MKTLFEVLLGSALLIGSMMIHGVGMYKVMHRFEMNWAVFASERNEIKRQLFIGWLITLMLLTHLAEITSWAAILNALNAVPDFRTAFYFSGETYTTVGFGDVVLPPQWRQLALFIAISGLFSFGWTTGVLVGMMNKTYEAHFAHLRNSKP
jgi:hypothetical protein